MTAVVINFSFSDNVLDVSEIFDNKTCSDSKVGGISASNVSMMNELINLVNVKECFIVSIA